MNSGKLTFWAPVALMRRSMSACISSQIANPHGRMTMVPRAGPFSASSARATTSWYHWGKSFPWGVSTALLATAGGLLDLAAAVPGSLLEQRRGQLPAVAAGKWVVVAEDAEDVEHQLAGPLAALPRPLAHGGQQLGQGLVHLAVGGPPRGLGKARALRALRARAGGLLREPGAGERLGHLGVVLHGTERLDRLARLAPVQQQPREPHAGGHVVLVVGEDLAVAGLGRGRVEHGGLGDGDVGLARQQRLDELLDHLRRLRADELVDQPAVRDRLDRGNALHPEGGGELRRLVDVDPRQLPGPVAGHDRPLQQRPERAARRAPAGPEVDDHRDLVGPLYDLGLEIGLGHVVNQLIAHTVLVRLAATRTQPAPAALRPGGLLELVGVLLEMVDEEAVDDRGHGHLAEALVRAGARQRLVVEAVQQGEHLLDALFHALEQASRVLAAVAL